MRKLSIVLLTGALLAAALPLAASAMTVGVSDEVDSTIMTGHLTTCSSTYEQHTGTEWSNESSTKNGSETDSSNTTASVVDPAASAGSSTGTFNVSVSSNAGTAGTYNTISETSSSLTGAQEAQTSNVNTVSAFATP